MNGKDPFRPRPMLDVRCAGQPREDGLAIGSTLHDRIAEAKSSIAKFETFRAQRPWWMPFTMYRILAERRARHAIEPNVAAAFPTMVDRIRGIAEGAKTSVDFLYLFHAMESVSAPAGAIAAPAPSLAGCTAVAATAARTTTGEAIVAHNFDLVRLAEPLLSARETQGEQYRYLGFTLAPMAGMVDGINEAGLSISYDYAPTTDLRPERPPISFAVEDTLANCSTVRSAVSRLKQLPRSGGAMLMLADADGDVASLELSAHNSHLRRPDDDVVHHSNAYQSLRMQEFELPRNAVYTDNAPAALQGVPIYESAELRDKRMDAMLREAGPLDSKSLHQLMADHGTDGSGSANTVCMHGGYWSTLASVQLFPAERRMRLSYGRACEADFVDFQL